MEKNNMEEFIYNESTKQVYLKFDRTMIVIDIEDFMEVLYGLDEVKKIITADPDVEIGEFEDDEGNTWQEFIVKEPNQEYS
jgi:hypothetical protein